MGSGYGIRSDEGERMTANDVQAQPAAEITDVWSRSASKYRIRATALLILNIVLFAGLGCFAYWLRTGEVFAPAVDGYWRELAATFMPKGGATLANFVLFPIRVDVVPMHGVVVGLLLAALVSIPILISILYRFPSCLPFVLVIGFLAVMPWLAITILGACVLTSVKPFRFRFRYASALLGLVLVLLYFYGASRQTTPLVAQYAPEDRIKFLAPWVLATIASCVIMGGVLFLARMVNYRPGVVAPLLLISFVVPVVLFETYVGRGELYYRLFEKRFQSHFLMAQHHVDHDVSEWFEMTAVKVWESKPYPRPSFETSRSLTELRMALELENYQRSLFARECNSLIEECRDFVLYFPDSRYSPNILYLMGEIMDTRIDLAAFRDKKVIRYYDDFPSQQSENIWRKVIHNAPDSTISAVGRYRLAILEAREGALEEAIVLLDDLITRFDSRRPQPADPVNQGGVNQVLKSAPADASLKVPVEQTVFEAKQLMGLLLQNGSDPRFGKRPFCGSRPGEPRQPGLLQLDPRHIRYEENLQGIIQAYPECLLEDNLMLMIANLADSAEERIRLLEECVERYPNGDAAIEAYFRLGVAYLESNSPRRARQVWENIVQTKPDDGLWKPLAEERLSSMPAITAPSSS